ncbi:MAG: fumarate reductase/succinate dehydrogenase flavoprotein subunit [Verrucomicrobia bacterium]|nr:fumarate reductase/succinate dehydrogenase flavoprotein subunit [Verrucomicrobiota bacterium]
MSLNSNIPSGPMATKWSKHKQDSKLINPKNKRKFTVLVVGSGLAGSSAAATLSELGYKVKCFCFQDSARRAHSIAAQGGINAAKNYQNDGDSVHRLFYDTVKGGDFRAREANVHRLAEVSVNIIDQCVAQGVPFAREYGGMLANRSFGGAQVSRTFYARGQTGQQLLLGAYSALNKEIASGGVKMYPRTEMLDLVTVDGHAKGIVTRDLVTGKIESHAGDAVLLCTGGYGNVFYLSTNAMGCNVTATWRAHRKGAFFANPCYTQIHPTCIPVSGEYQSKLTLMSESLRNDGRVWVPKKKEDSGKTPDQIPEADRDYVLERKYPSFGNLAPRDISSRAAKEACDEGRGVGPGGRGVYLDFAEAIGQFGAKTIAERYGNLFDMYERITGESAFKRPMRIYPAVHYTMGQTKRFLSIKGKRSVDSFHRELGLLIWDKCGMARTKEGLTEALNRIPALREEFWQNVNVPGSSDFTNPELEKAGRVADFMEFAELLCLDARHREESCGGHFRSEHQYPDGEAKRDDENFSYAAAWEYTGNLSQPTLNKEPLTFDEVHLAVRSYK